MNIYPHAIVIDLGTTTVTAAAIDAGGNILMQTNEMNAQHIFDTDVISRLQSAASGKLSNLCDLIRTQINKMCRNLLNGQRIENTVIVGNTIVLHLLFGAKCEGLGRFPYTPDFLHARQKPGVFFGWDWTDSVYTPPCLHAFCGADITAGLLTLTNMPKPYMLADLGTNAELALITDSGLFVTSAAAGPVFEGAGISCGMPALPGAIYSFSLMGNRARVTTIDGIEPIGICASGLIDLLAELRRTYRLSTDGRLTESYKITSKLSINQVDVRAFQLAKAAVAAGIQLLCKHANVSVNELNIAVSGALGSALNFKNAARLGLLFNSSGAIGNSALQGGIHYALSPKLREYAENFTKCGEYVDLSLMPEFQQTLLDNINFPDA